MTGKAFVDTNVLVYAYDRSEPAKQARALQVIDDLMALRAGVISAQVLIEFYNAVTRRIAAPLAPDVAYDRIKNLVWAWSVLDITPLIALEAARGASQHQLRIWDAQIWATARLNQIPIVLSEDFSDGTAIEGVRTLNPFTTSFRLHDWL
jgi:predicted nucleic acid-binding protein